MRRNRQRHIFAESVKFNACMPICFDVCGGVDDVACIGPTNAFFAMNPQGNRFRIGEGTGSEQIISDATPSFDADAIAYWSQAAVEPSDAAKVIINAFVTGLKSNNLWTKFGDANSAMAQIGPDQTLALTHVDDPTRTETAFNSPTFTANQGWVGDGATTYIEETGGPNSRDIITSGSGMYYLFTAGTLAHTSGSSQFFGQGNRTRISVGSSAGSYVSTASRIECSANIDTGWGGTADSGAAMFAMTRRNEDDPNNTFSYLNGVQTAKVDQPVGLGSGGMRVWRSASTSVTEVAAWGYSSAIWTDAEMLTFYNLLSTYLTDIGAL